jgi:hypothetical protein
LNAAVLAIVALTLVIEGTPPPKGPESTRLCIENATDGLVGAWIWYRHYPFESRVIAAGRTDCMTLKGYSQLVDMFVGKGERTVPGTAALFPDRVDSRAGAHCPPNVEGGSLAFKVTRMGASYRCEDAR